MNKLNITTCPSCGSKKIKRVRGDSIRNFNGKEYTVPDLEYYECADCGEKVYDRDAMRKIQKYSPSFQRVRAKRKSARAARSATSRP
ncbi:MAG TPA: YgiT-type zinc finger protein [Blastocatellia bacterium]